MTVIVVQFENGNHFGFWELFDGNRNILVENNHPIYFLYTIYLYLSIYLIDRFVVFYVIWSFFEIKTI